MSKKVSRPLVVSFLILGCIVGRMAYNYPMGHIDPPIENR